MDFIKYFGENTLNVIKFSIFILFIIYNILFLIRISIWVKNSRKDVKPDYFGSLRKPFKKFNNYKYKGQ